MGKPTEIITDSKGQRWRWERCWDPQEGHHWDLVPVEDYDDDPEPPPVKEGRDHG